MTFPKSQKRRLSSGLKDIRESIRKLIAQQNLDGSIKKTI
jgi:hypothetical protein